MTALRKERETDPIDLRASGFEPNGHGKLRGTIIAYTPEGDALGVSMEDNWSRPQTVKKFVAELVEVVGINSMVATALVRRTLARVQGLMDDGVRAGPPKLEHELPAVMISGRPLRDITTDSWKLLVEAEGETRFFGMGDTLAVVDSTRRPLKPRLLTVPSLRHFLDNLADFTGQSAEGNEYPARPPKDMLETMLAVVSRELPPLNGVMSSPFVAPDGEIVTSEGYHPPTGLYLALGSLSVPPVAQSPTDGDIAEARRLLLDELLGDFQFAGEADKAHALAAIISPVARPLVAGPSPLFVIEAPVAGSGKSLIAQVIATIATGDPPRVMVEGGDEAEWRKRITATLIDTPMVVLIDNLRKRLDSAAVSAAITAMVWSDRPMGLSRMVNIPVQTTWLATGNNPAFSEEISRRVVRIRINTLSEKPWERQGPKPGKKFKHPELASWALEERGRLLWSALTLVRAWIVAGKPQGTESMMGSFDQWARTLGGVLGVAGVPGLLTNRHEVYQQAEAEAEAWRMLIEKWLEEYGDKQVGVRDLFELAKKHQLLTDLKAGRTEQGAKTVMGITLSQMRDRAFGEYIIISKGTVPHLGGIAYQLKKISELTVDGEKGQQPPQGQQTLDMDGRDPADPADPKSQRGLTEENNSRDISVEHFIPEWEKDATHNSADSEGV